MVDAAMKGLKDRSLGSGHRFGDAPKLPKSAAPLGVRFAAITLALLFWTCAVAETAADHYKAHCSACHGANGNGDTMLGKNLKLRPLASEEVQKQSDAELGMVIAKGRNRMPSFERKLTKEQIANVVKYVRSLKH